MAKRNGKSLLARKQELLNDLKYYEKRLEEVRKKSKSHFHYESSDSDEELTVHIEPSVAELKLKYSMLQTCFSATLELMNIQILQSEVNVVSEPVFERDLPTNEEGIWREVTAECKVDLVTFSINFYVHKPKRLFTPFTYKNLQVNPVRSAHKQELANSVLHTVETPSDAVEVLRNYAKAHRSRRSTFAKLAETYGDTLFMTPLPEGGYILKCADVLEISWTLLNKWSHIAPFHHKMKFDLEYLDESYIKIVAQLHRQLSDPSIETDERTMLISKIINTCLEAKKQTDKSKNESNIDKDKDIKDKDSEKMAPPKLIPKNNKKKMTVDYGNVKRAKVDNKKENSSTNNNKGVSNMNSNFDDKSTTFKQSKEVVNKKNKEGDNFPSTSNSDIKSNNKTFKNIYKNKVDLKGKKTKVIEKKSGSDNKETWNTDKEKNKANLKLNEELNKKNNEIDSKINENNSNKNNTKSVTDLKSRNNVTPNNEINRNKIGGKTKRNENKLEIDAKNKHTNLTNNSNLSNVQRNKVTSKIPKRVPKNNI